MHPFRCPVCDGRQTLPADYYTAPPVEYGYADEDEPPEGEPVPCRSCTGTGVVWSSPGGNPSPAPGVVTELPVDECFVAVEVTNGILVRECIPTVVYCEMWDGEGDRSRVGEAAKARAVDEAAFYGRDESRTFVVRTVRQAFALLTLMAADQAVARAPRALG